jgi:hypothetical protein
VSVKRRAMPPLSDIEAAKRGIRVDRDGLVRCRVCGCTEREPCNPPCGWLEVDLCTSCASAVLAITGWLEGAYRANVSGLLREAKKQSSYERIIS